MFKKILVPLDGSDLSSHVVRQACTLARHLGARLVFYHAKPGYLPDYIPGEVVFGMVSVDVAFIEAVNRQAIEILNNAEHVAEIAGVESEKLSDEYNAPYQGIIAAAKNQGCDLIFMASHGRRGASALLLGSETQKVLTHCTIPVLVYR